MIPAQHVKPPDGAQETATEVIGAHLLSMGYKRLDTVPKKQMLS